MLNNCQTATTQSTRCCAVAVAQVSVTDSSFSSNSAESGGAVLAVGNGSLILAHCSFANNSVTFYGGALSAGWRSRVALEACRLDGNTAVENGGAVRAMENTQVGCWSLIVSG